jgi:hypothetical protein
MTGFRRSDRYKNDGLLNQTCKEVLNKDNNGTLNMRLNPSTTLSIMNGARALWKWLRRPSSEEQDRMVRGVELDVERERLRIHLEHQQALGQLRADRRQERMTSVMGMFASVQANKQRRLGQVGDVEGEH